MNIEPNIDRACSALDANLDNHLTERAILWMLRDGALSYDELRAALGKHVRAELKDLVKRRRIRAYNRGEMTFYKLV